MPLGLRGESIAPADLLPGALEAPLSWRDIMEGAGFTGPLRALAAQAQVLELTEARVQLRFGVNALLTSENRTLMERRVRDWLGRPFSVEFVAGEAETGTTVAEEDRERRKAEHQALIERFKADPVVKDVVRLLGGTIDEDSIRPSQADED